MIVQLEAAIRARLVGDSTLTGLLGSAASVYNQVMVPAVPFPYVVYQVDVAQADDMFRTARDKYTFRVHWYSEERPPDNAYDPIARGAAIEIRIRGDWTEQAAGTPPTYGLDRWQPDISASGWTADICRRQIVTTDHGPGVFHWIMDFAVDLNRAGA